MSWDYPPPRKPFYRRAWFYGPLLFLLVVGLAGVAFAFYERSKWDALARQFDYSRLTEMESASIIYDRDGQVLGRIFIQNRDQVPLEDLSPELLKAVIGAEDARFYQHEGVDYFGIFRAMVKNYQKGRASQGASTLTQQLARNTFTEELPSSDRTYKRKLLEMSVAREIEKRLSKQQILDLYLNRVYFGSGFYGAEAASRGYFGKHAKDLNLSEASMLTGLLKSPNTLSPWRNRQACIDQRNYVLQRMLELKLITKEEYDSTRNEDLIVKNRRPIHQESYAAEMVAQQVKRLVGDESAVSEGYRIYTTIDSNLQKKAEASLREKLAEVERNEAFAKELEGTGEHAHPHQTYAQFDQAIRAYRRKAASEGENAGPQPEPEYLQGSVVVMDNATGGLLALVGGRDFSHSPYNRAFSAKRPVGTAYLPLVYAAAFENGLFPGTAVQDTVIDNRQVMIGGMQGILGEWGQERMDFRYEGTISARTALEKSKNAATVRLGMAIGKNLGDSLGKLTALSKNAGITSPVRQFPAAFLGSSEMTPMEMTLAMSAFASDGSRPERPFIIQRIEEKSGRVIFQEKPARARAMSPTTAYEVHSCLADVLERGTADKPLLTELGLKRYALGGKTGTAYDFTDLWFLGYSSQVTCSVWAGFDKPRTKIYRGAFSNEVALPIWANVMKETLAKYKPQEIVPPKGLIKVEICASSGLLATDKCFDVIENKETGEKIQRRTTYTEMATEAQAPKDGCDVHGEKPRQYNRPGQGPVPQDLANVTVRPAIPVNAPVTNMVVAMKSPTVLGLDPYNSIQATRNAEAMRNMRQPQLESGVVAAPAPNSTPDEPQVQRAIQVGPMEDATQVESLIKLDPPKPIEF